MFDEKFWVACSFICFILVIFKPLKEILLKVLDTRIAKIQAKLDEAEKLRKEAEGVLEAYNTMQLNALNETKQLVENAEKKVSALIVEAQVQLDRSIERRKSASLQKIASYEAEILKDMREQAVSLAISVVQKMLKDRLAGKASDPQFNQVLSELDKKLH